MKRKQKRCQYVLVRAYFRRRKVKQHARFAHKEGCDGCCRWKK